MERLVTIHDITTGMRKDLEIVGGLGGITTIEGKNIGRPVNLTIKTIVCDENENPTVAIFLREVRRRNSESSRYLVVVYNDLPDIRTATREQFEDKIILRNNGGMVTFPVKGAAMVTDSKKNCTYIVKLY